MAEITSRETHPPPDRHPERPTRLFGICRALQSGEFDSFVTPLEIKSVPPKRLKSTHSSEYIDELTTYRGVGIGYLDADTYRSATSFEASCQVTGTLLSGIDAAFGSGPNKSFIIGRPPGHHAEYERAMGFCLVNHIAVAAHYALDEYNCARVAVVDFDVHHGNGTQHIFYDRSDLLYISTHQFPFYPGTGSDRERGEGEGTGYTFNIPLAAGIDDRTIVELFETKISRALREYQPGIILVSAGFDGHQLDPLGGFSLTGAAYKRIGAILNDVSEDVCHGRLVSLMEGGYSPEGNLDAFRNYMKGLVS